ncbi:hypothetical protein PSI19_18670 [Xenorhabdus khoisanae]|uniref:hypothetical protein n=1 Tax=Xenorhabdus khoisanae TaxID=880157 RepID=UPI00235A0AE7|nr:hypothetical protein [Xenorhabdus khoisanae]MDC9615855.1 hypothetical protein [Xenorhabdus khoisanae]
MPKHIHADLISEYARLSHITDSPWEYFEVNYGKNWHTLKSECGFDHVFAYRLKPRTIKIGSYDVPEPVRNESEINDGEFYHVPYFLNGFADTYRCVWVGNDHEMERLRNGLIHKDRESAELHARALIALTAK